MKKILILRLSGWITVKQAVGYAIKIYPGCSIDIFMQKDIKPPFDITGVSFYASSDNALSFFEIRKFIKSRGGYDDIILPYNNIRGDGYFKRELTFLLLPVKNKHVVNIYGQGKQIKKRGMLFRRFNRFVSYILSFKCFTPILVFLTTVIIKFIYLFGGKKDNSDVVFITHFGYALPSARIRCYNFSGILNSAGISSVVLSLEDHFGVLSDETLLPEKLWANIRLSVKLLDYSKSVLVVLKPEYHYLAPYFMVKSLGNKLVFDHDGWDMDTDVFKGVKATYVVDKLISVSSVNVAASNTLYQYFTERRCKSIFIPTGPDTEKFKPFSPKKFYKQSNEIICGWIGMVWGKPIADNLKYLFECVNELDDSRIKVHIAIGGAAVEYVRRYAEEILGDRAVIHYMINPDYLMDFINFTDIGCFPFTYDSKYNETKSPAKLFEYMACGKPSISTPVGEIPSVIKHERNGFLARDKEEFKKYLSFLADSAELRERIGAAALETILNDYSLDVCGHKFARVVRPYI